MLGRPMTLAELIEGLAKLNAPNQGMSYHASGMRRGGPKYDSQTGERLFPPIRAAELNVYGSRADFLYRLIENGEQLAALLSSSHSADDRSREAASAPPATDTDHV